LENVQDRCREKKIDKALVEVGEKERGTSPHTSRRTVGKNIAPVGKTQPKPTKWEKKTTNIGATERPSLTKRISRQHNRRSSLIYPARGRPDGKTGWPQVELEDAGKNCPQDYPVKKAAV